MTLLEPALTDDSSLNMTLSKMTKEINSQRVSIREVLTAIQNATSFADLQLRLKDR